MKNLFRTINGLLVQIKPHSFLPDCIEYQITVRVSTGRGCKEYKVHQVYHDDQFVSAFDVIWDAAKDEILRAVEEG